MIAAKMLIAAVLTAAAASLAGAPLAQADPPNPGQTQYLSNGPGDPPCPEAGCQPAPPKATPPPVRGVLGCVRGVCIPNPRPPWQRH